MKRGFQVMLACAALLLASGALLHARARRASVRLTWSSSQTGMVFNIRAFTNGFEAPALSWPIVATTTGHMVVLPIDRSAGDVWFALTASNALGESPFATP